MNEQDLKDFKDIYKHTDFKFTLKDGVIIIEKPRKLIYTDPENGDEFLEGEESYWFDVSTFEVHKSENQKQLIFKAIGFTSKNYNTRKKCEIALMIFIAKKHGFLASNMGV